MSLLMVFLLSLGFATPSKAAAPSFCEAYLKRGELITPWMKSRWKSLDVRGQRTILYHIHKFIQHRVDQHPLMPRDQREFSRLLLLLFGEAPRVDDKTSKELWMPWVLMEIAAIPETHQQAEYELEEILLLFDVYERDHGNRVRF